VYSDAPVLILDDPFSAVDANVGEHLFNQCVRGLLKDKTILLITNQA
jgi:ABC-type nitrate/sulfonate/bicarbonate transport system ATPase subunit